MKIKNIKWDTNNNGEILLPGELGLPTEIEVDEEMEEDDIADYLSDEYEYCVESFEIE